MGFFSKTCAKTHLPVLHHGHGGGWHARYPELFTIVVLYPDGRKVEGVYDGYGRVDGDDLCGGAYDHDLWESLKFVLAKYYAGETYADLGPSGDELGQGHFMDEQFIKACIKKGQFATRADYEKAFKQSAGW